MDTHNQLVAYSHIICQEAQCNSYALHIELIATVAAFWNPS